MWKEFQQFVNKGNAFELAVAVIIGGIFGAIVNSLVNDIIMPLIGILIGGVNFTGLILQVGKSQVRYGNFIQAVVNFFIVGFVLFFIVRSYNKLKAYQDKQLHAVSSVTPQPPADVILLTEIRDILKDRAGSPN